jgi:hypothetical protein
MFAHIATPNFAVDWNAALRQHAEASFELQDWRKDASGRSRMNILANNFHILTLYSEIDVSGVLCSARQNFIMLNTARPHPAYMQTTGNIIYKMSSSLCFSYRGHSQRYGKSRFS